MKTATPDGLSFNISLLAGIFFALTCLDVFNFPAREAWAQEPAGISLAVVACADAVRSYEHHLPLIRYLERKTGLAISPRLATHPEKLKELLQKGQADFVLVVPPVYVALSDLLEPDALLQALSPAGTPYYHGEVVVRRDSGIETLLDLKDKSVMFGPDQAGRKGLALQLLLAEKNIKVSSKIGGGCCQNIAFSVFLGEADAGVVCGDALCRVRRMGVFDTGQLKVIAQTLPMRKEVFAPRKGVPAVTIKTVEAALLEFDRPSGAGSHSDMDEIGGFIPASDREYDDLRMIMNQIPN